MAATIEGDVIRTTSALGDGQGKPVIIPPVSQVQMLWQHYVSARSTLERLAAEGAALDVHSPYAERAVRLLEVLVLRKDKGKGHFLNVTLGAPVIPNNPEFDPTGAGKRRSELPPTDDVPELVERALAELEHAMQPHVRPGARALDVSNAAKALQEGIAKARATTKPPAAKQATIPATEPKKPAASSCCSSVSTASSSACKSTAGAATAAPTGAGASSLRHRHRHNHKGHGHGSTGGGCCPSETTAPASALSARLAAVAAWAKALLSGPEAVKEHMHMPGGGCCGGGAAGRSRMGEKQDGHGFMVAVLALVLVLPFLLWWMS